MQTQQQATAAPFSTSTPPPSSGGSASEAPPKLVAQAMDKLGQAGRIIADNRIGADRLLEALFVAASQPHQGNKPLQLFAKEDACMRQYFQDLRSLDGAVVAYAGNDSLRDKPVLLPLTEVGSFSSILVSAAIFIFKIQTDTEDGGRRQNVTFAPPWKLTWHSLSRKPSSSWRPSNNRTPLVGDSPVPPPIGPEPPSRTPRRGSSRTPSTASMTSVTGDNPDEKTVDLLISTEIKERHDGMKELERNLKELQQEFLDMAVLIQSQGEQLDNIESHVARANSFGRVGFSCCKLQGSTRNSPGNVSAMFLSLFYSLSSW
ncbi:hypothetical protein Fmac_006595 [Flemingia macrophylla]|uniref:t-SNARE coiled-coil homology domain-containing protein n=1 Tax=Flemingia macrophylla TaxID=520843 RepID=A0ABD1NB34_9FABA